MSVPEPDFARFPEPCTTLDMVEFVEAFVVRVKPVPRERLPPVPAMAPIVMLLPMASVPAVMVVRPG